MVYTGDVVPQVRSLSTLPTGSPYEVLWVLVPWRPVFAIAVVFLGLPAAMLVRGQARPNPWTVAALVLVVVLLFLLLVRLPQRTGRGIRLAADMTGIGIAVGPAPERVVFAPWDAVHLVMFTEPASPQPVWLPWTRPINLIRIVLPTAPPDVCDALRAGGLLLEESTAKAGPPRGGRDRPQTLRLRPSAHPALPLCGLRQLAARARRAQERLRELPAPAPRWSWRQPAAPIWLELPRPG